MRKYHSVKVFFYLLCFSFVIFLMFSCKKKLTCYDCVKNLGDVDEVRDEICVDKKITHDDLIKVYGWQICDLKK